MSRFSRVPFGSRRIGIRNTFFLSIQTVYSHGFGERRGLTQKAPVYGGWESEEVAGPNQSLPGAIAGFYLSSMANCYDNTHDPRIRERLISMVAGLEECQQAFGDGYLLPTKNGHQLFERVSSGEIVT